jgi:hypothetical protein
MLPAMDNPSSQTFELLIPGDFGGTHYSDNFDHEVRFAPLPKTLASTHPFRESRGSAGGRDSWSSPTVKSAMNDGIQSHTALQQAMLRERMFAVSARPAGQLSGIRPGKVTAGDTIWGTIKHSEIKSTNGHVGKGESRVYIPSIVKLIDMRFYRCRRARRCPQCIPFKCGVIRR